MPEHQIHTITVETEESGTRYLRLGLKIRDVIDLSELQGSETDAREFTVQTVTRLIRLPEIKIEEVRSWDDDLLISVATTWAKAKGGTEWPLQEDLPPFEAFKHGYTVYVTSMLQDMVNAIREVYAPIFRQTMIEVGNVLSSAFRQQLAEINQSALEAIRSSINLMAESALDALRQNMANIVQSITLQVDVGKFFLDLPEFSELVKRYEETADVLDESGFRFMRYHWSLSDISQFVGIRQVDLRVRHAVVINRLLGLTRSDEFAAGLEDYFNRSTVLRRRWNVVNQALKAHRNRQYILSIPVLLAQVEGVFTDALILKNMVIRQNGKLYAKDQNGYMKLDKCGRPVQVHGLGQKVQNSSFRNDDLLRDLVDFFASRLVAERNDIMHGDSFDYGKAKLSAQLVLNLYVLAAEFAEFESEN